MLKRIIVPLDGSGFAEQAIPMALRLAERDRSEIELVHVYETLPPYVVQGAPPLDPTLDHDLERDRRAYLDAIAGWLRSQTSLTVTTAVLEGDVEPTLARHVADRRADLVVMATHGRGGLSQLWIGSVASDLARDSVAPVLLVRPSAAGSRTQALPAFEHVLVPLDGNPEDEEAIEHVTEVANDRGVEFMLLTVLVPVMYVAEPASLAVVDELELQRAMERYLEHVAGRIRARGFHVETRVDVHPSPARSILDVATEIGADLIAMETHGHRRIARVVLGSVADKVIRAATAPVLVHRPRVGEGTAGAGAASRAAAR